MWRRVGGFPPALVRVTRGSRILLGTFSSRDHRREKARRGLSAVVDRHLDVDIPESLHRCLFCFEWARRLGRGQDLRDDLVSIISYSRLGFYLEHNTATSLDKTAACAVLGQIDSHLHYTLNKALSTYERMPPVQPISGIDNSTHTAKHDKAVSRPR